MSPFLLSRYLFVRATDRCSACSAHLMSKAFHLFNCGHKFHTDCLAKELKPMLSSSRLRRLNEVERELARLELSTTGPEPNGNNRVEQARADLDALVAHECLFCGDAMVKMVDTPLIDADDFDRIVAEWL